MNLLNTSALFAATGLLVPIVIHLWRKRRARVVAWSAMQFLSSSLTRRRRGLAIENRLLLLNRCLIILLLALAAARPLVPYHDWGWNIAFFVLLGGGLWGLTTAAVRSFASRTRWTGLAATIVLLPAAGVLLYSKPNEVTDAAANCDLVIVLDESSTMLIEGQEGPPFAEAVRKARGLVDRLSGSSTVSIVRAGPLIETVAGSPFRDLDAADRVLSQLRPAGGGADIGAALEQATALADRGLNPGKQIVLFTDNQLRTWDSVVDAGDFQTDGKPDNTAAALDTPAKKSESNEDSIHYAVHPCPLPVDAQNISLAPPTLRNPLVISGQKQEVTTVLTNHNVATTTTINVELLLNGELLTTENVGLPAPGVNSLIRFSCTFPDPGDHVVTVRTHYDDLLAHDNEQSSVVSTIPFVSVLLINGNHFAAPETQSATFLQLALDPFSAAPDLTRTEAVRPIRVRNVTIPDVDQLSSFDEYDVIILSEALRVPGVLSDRLGRYAQQGGGLWIIPDEQADSSSYNQWLLPDSADPLLPVTLLPERPIDADWGSNDASLTIDLGAPGSDASDEVFEGGQHDLADATIRSSLPVTVPESSVVEWQLSNGAPMFVSKSAGVGRILVQTVSLSRRNGNLPLLVSFPVLMHLQCIRLARCRDHDLNFPPSSTLNIPINISDSGQQDRPASSYKFQCTDPSGDKHSVNVNDDQQQIMARIHNARSAGVYEIRRDTQPPFVRPFIIRPDPLESDPAVIPEEDLTDLQSRFGLESFTDPDGLKFLGSSDAPAFEMSPYLLWAVLCFVTCESLLIRSLRRRRTVTSSSVPTTFRARSIDETGRGPSDETLSSSPYRPVEAVSGGAR